MVKLMKDIETDVKVERAKIIRREDREGESVM